MISLCQLSLSLLNKNNITCHGAPSWAEGIQTEGTVADLFWAKKSYFSVYLLQFNQSKSEVLSVQQVWIQVQVCAELLLTAALMKCLSTEGAAAAVSLTRPRLQYLILNSILGVAQNILSKMRGVKDCVFHYWHHSHLLTCRQETWFLAGFLFQLVLIIMSPLCDHTLSTWTELFV